MGNCTVTNLTYHSAGDEKKVDFLLTLSASYATSGDTLTAAQLGLAQINRLEIANEKGFVFEPDIASSKLTALIKAYQGGEGGFTPAGTNGTSSVSAQVFTGTAPASAVNYGTPVFSGTGQTSAGQVITTTDNQTMTLNQCAGMWFVSATHGPYLIASNTAVTGAPAVLTIYGDAPTTDAGTYKILTGVTPAGTNSTSTAAAQVFTGTAVPAGAADEVANGTDLTTTPGAITVSAYGY